MHYCVSLICQSVCLVYQSIYFVLNIKELLYCNSPVGQNNLAICCQINSLLILPKQRFVNMKKLMMNRGSFDIVLYCIIILNSVLFMYLISTLFIILQFVSLLFQTVKDFLMVVLEGQWSLASDTQGKKIIFIATKGITGLLYTHNILTGDCNVWIAVPRKLLFQFFSIYKERCCL